MGDDLYVVVRASQEQADINQLISDIQSISKNLKNKAQINLRVGVSTSNEDQKVLQRQINAVCDEISKTIKWSISPHFDLSSFKADFKKALKDLDNQKVTVNVQYKESKSGTIKRTKSSSGSSSDFYKSSTDTITSYIKRYQREQDAFYKKYGLYNYDKSSSSGNKADDKYELIRQYNEAEQKTKKLIDQYISGTNQSQSKELLNQLAASRKLAEQIKSLYKENDQMFNKARLRIESANAMLTSREDQAKINKENNPDLVNLRYDLSELQKGVSEIEKIPMFEKDRTKLKELNQEALVLQQRIQSTVLPAPSPQTERAYDAIINRLDRFRANNTKINYDSELIQLYQEIRNDALYKRKSVSDLRAAEQSLRTMSYAKGLSGLSSSDLFMGQLKKFTQWFSVSQIVMGGVLEVQKMYQAVKDVDTAMTELKKVTDETDASYQSFLDKAIVRAQELGTKVSDLVNATADFVRVGYDIDTASAYADAATVYKNVGDGIEDISEASESIISTTKAFADELNEPMEIVDKFNEVGNRTAISSQGIGEALKRSASALAAAGNDLNESIGLIVAANSVVQDPDVVGTALKTMSMRIRGASTGDMEAEGLDTEGMVESVSKLREDLIALSGVDIMIDDTSFKSTYDIMVELSKIWDDLSDITQANIIEKIAGKRQGNIVASMMENMQDGIDAVGYAANSSGSALAENERYLDSVAGRLDKLSASYESLATKVMNSDFLNTLLDIGGGFLSFADSTLTLTNSWSLFFGAVLAGGPTLLGLKTGLKEIVDENGKAAFSFQILGKSIEDIRADFADGKNLREAIFESRFDPYSGLTKNDITSLREYYNLYQEEQRNLIPQNQRRSNDLIGSLSTRAQEWIPDLQSGATTIDELSGGLNRMSRAASIGRKALVGLSQVGVFIGITAVTAVITKLTEAILESIPTYNNLKEQAKESVSAYEDSKAQLENMNNELQTTQDRIRELKSLGTLSVTEESELRELQAQNQMLQQQIDLQERLHETSKKSAAGAALSAFQKGDFTDESAAISKNILAIEDEIELVQSSGFSDEKKDSWVQSLQAELENEYEKLNEINAEINDIFTPDQLMEWNDTDSGKKLLDEYVDYLTASATTVEDKFNALRLDSRYQEFFTQVEELGSVGELSEKTVERLIADYDGLDNKLEDLNITIPNLIKQFTSLSKETSSVSESIGLDDVQNTVDSLNKYIEEYNSTGYLTSETVRSMLSDHPEYVKYLVKEGDLYKLNTDALNDYERATAVRNGLLDEYVQQVEESVSGTKAFASGIVESIDEIKQSGEISSQLWDEIGLDYLRETNQAFAEGGISVEQYFLNLKSYSDGIDFSSFENKASIASQGIQTVMSEMFVSIAQGMQFLTKQFSSNLISFEEYYDGILAGAKSLRSFSDDMAEAQPVFERSNFEIEPTKATEEYTPRGVGPMAPKGVSNKEQLELNRRAIELSKELTDSYNDLGKATGNAAEQGKEEAEVTESLLENIEDAEHLNYFVDFLNDQSDAIERYINNSGDIEFPSPDVEGYEEFADGISSILQEVGEDSVVFTTMARAAEEATGQTEGTITSVEQLSSVLRSNSDAMNAATEAASREVGNIMNALLTSVGSVLTSLAELIENFSVTLNIKVEGSQSLTGGLFGGIKIPESITISAKQGEGSAAHQFAQELKQLGTSFNNLGDLTAQDIIQQRSQKSTEAAEIQTEETSQKIQDISDKLKELDEEEHLDRLKKSIEEVQLLIDQLDRTMDTIDLSLDLTSENDFSARFDLYASKFDIAVEKGKVLRDEFNRLANTTPQTSNEAQELANRLESLGSEIQSNIRDVVEYRNELNRLNLNAVSRAVEEMMDTLDRQSRMIDHDIDSLINGSMIDGLEPFSIDFLLPEIPEDALTRQRRENKEYQEEEQKHQEIISEIKRQALEMQYAQLAEVREKERQDLVQQREELQVAVSEDAARIKGAVSDTSNYTVGSFSQAGISAGQSFATNFNATASSIVESSKDLAMTFATSFVAGLQNGNVIGAGIQAAIATGLAASGGLAANEVSDDNQLFDASPAEFYANGHNKYGGTHAKDRGIDYAHPEGTPIPAAWGGTVIKVANLGNKSYGKYVTIASDDGKNHVYAHMIRQKAVVGQKVRKGQIIGYVGSTGKSTGNHVHVSNAWGTYIDTTGMATGGIVRPNEQTLVGEKGRELAKLPDGRIVLLGAHGAELCDLPPATQIIDNKNTEEILKYTGNRIIGKKVSKYGNGNKTSTTLHNCGSNVPKFASGTIDPQWITLANQIQAKYGIPSSLVLAQLILESAWGTSNLARNANNYFGMKGTGTAGSYNGYQRYNSMAESFEAYARNLTSGKYYNVAGLTSTDFNGWIDRIAETYAPNQNYAAKIKQLASSYNLTQYDQMISSAVTTTVQAAEETKTAAEKARELVEKYTEVPQTYSKEFLLDYRDYAEKRAKHLDGIEDMLKIDPDRAREILDIQRAEDIQKSYEMKVDMYTNAAEKLQQNYQDLLAEFDKIKDTADVDVLQEYIEGLSDIQQNLYDIDETLREAAHSLYLYETEHIDNQLKLLDNQYDDASYRNNFNEMVRNYQKQIELYQEIMQKASEEADRIRMTGASEDADYIQECIDDWWEAYNAIRQYREELENLIDLQESNYKDTLSDFQQSYIDIFNNAISDLQHQKDNDPVLQSLYDQREALEQVNEERQNELTLMRAKENLAKLQKTTLVYQKGVGWVYQADENALREAKENLNDAQTDYDLSKLDQEIEEREKYYDDQIEDIQKFIDNLEYEMEVYLRESATSIAEVMETLRKLGVDTFENIEHITEWLDSLFAKINEDEYFKEHFSDLEGSYEEDLYYNLLKEMVYKERELSSLDADDESERNRLREEIDQIANMLGLTKQDNKYFTADGKDAYEIGAELIQEEIKNNSEQIKDSDSLQAALLKSNNEILQKLYDFITQKGVVDEQRSLLEEMVQNSAKWADADASTREKLHERNVEIGKQLGLIYNEDNGTWYTDDTQKMEAYAKIALAIMKENSAAWSEAESIEEKNFLHTINSFLGKMFNLSYNASTGKWEYKNGLEAYANGGVIDYSGYAEVHGGNASEMVLNNVDVAKLYDYIHNSPNLLVNAMKQISVQRIPQYTSPTPSVSYSFGNIYLQDVQNPNEFVKALKTELGTIIQREGLSIK